MTDEIQVDKQTEPGNISQKPTPLAVWVIAAIALTYPLLCFGFGFGRPYWLYVNSTTPDFADILCDSVQLVTLFSAFVWMVSNRKKLNFWMWLGLLSSMCSLCFFSSGIIVYSLNPDRAITQHIAEIRLNWQLWRLTYWQTGGSEGSYYRLFQCDPFGVMCSDTGIDLPDDVARPNPYRPYRLAADQTNQRVLLKDGEHVLYTYPAS